MIMNSFLYLLWFEFNGSSGWIYSMLSMSSLSTLPMCLVGHHYHHYHHYHHRHYYRHLYYYSFFLSYGIVDFSHQQFLFIVISVTTVKNSINPLPPRLLPHQFPAKQLLSLHLHILLPNGLMSSKNMFNPNRMIISLCQGKTILMEMYMEFDS